MGWLSDRKSKKTLKNLGMSNSDIDEITSTLKQGYNDATNIRNQLRKKESHTYRKLLKQINNISFEPIPVKKQHSMSVLLVNESILSEWERDDLLEQIESMYGEILKARPYLQVLSMLNHIKSDNVIKIKKIDSSIKIIHASELTEDERNELLEKVNDVYGL